MVPKPIPGFRRWQPWILASIVALVGAFLALIDARGKDAFSGALSGIAFWGAGAAVPILWMRKAGEEDAWDAPERTIFAAGLWLGTAGLGLAALLFVLWMPYDEPRRFFFGALGSAGSVALMAIAVVRDRLRIRWLKRVERGKEPGLSVQPTNEPVRALFFGEHPGAAVMHQVESGGAFRGEWIRTPLAGVPDDRHHTKRNQRSIVFLGFLALHIGTLAFLLRVQFPSSFDPPPRYTIEFPAGSKPIEEIALGNDSACARSASEMSCWQDHTFRLMRTFTFGAHVGGSPPLTKANPVDSPPITSISIGMSHTCTIDAHGDVRCFGLTESGRLGGEAFGAVVKPPGVIADTAVRAVAAGGHTTCALTNVGVECWGSGTFGMLARASLEESSRPVFIKGTEQAVDVRLGVDHACAILADGSVVCWGSNEHGQAGSDRGVTRIANLHHVKQISLGWYRSFALLGDGTVRAWGDNEYGALGDGTEINWTEPVAVKGLADVAEIAAGTHHTCARMRDSSVRCWGWNGTGALGDGSRHDRSEPVLVKGAHARHVAAGGTCSCILTTDGRVECWGENDTAD